MLRKHLPWLVVAAALSVAPRGVAGEAIDFGSLLKTMLDRTALAEFPEPGFVCKQASSYNRRSQTPGNPDWFAGGDFDQFQGCDQSKGRKEWIMLEAQGPGAVVRWWLTQYRGAGTIRIYLDGAGEPIFQGTGDQLVGGKTIVGLPLAATRGGGRNLYLPIPFREHCRITFESPNASADFATRSPGFKNESLFYNINYIQYPMGTDVKTLTKAELESSRELIARVGRELLELARHLLPVQRRVPGGRDTLQPGQTMTRTIAGSGAISVLRLKLEAKDLAQAMRSTVITATFDGQQTVWAPLGEFFGTGLGIHPYQDWWRKVDKDGWMTCWWPMPFKNSAEIKISNLETHQSVQVELDDLEIADWKWTDRTMYFHTAWRGENLIETVGDDLKHMKEWNFITIAGKGVFVGDSLSLYNRPDMKSSIGPWWGEGDEHIWVDGESFPSHFGTGSEDYYGYAFNSTQPFEAPFHAQPVAEGNWGLGHTTDERVRVLDRIPFQSAFQFDMELFHWQPKRRLDYATTTHWYAFAGATHNGQVEPAKVCERVAQPVASRAPKINGPGVCGIWPGTPFLQAIPATGKRPMEFSAKRLPPGLSVDPATGFITGTIEKPGEHTVTLRARNEFGTVERSLRIVCGEKLALTPPMGWMSWNLFGCDINEEKMKALADAMVASGLRDAGYQYLSIDDCWAYKRAADGSILADENRFPGGIKALADYAHARGLKLGIYSDAAEHTCAGAMGSYGHEEQDARTFAQWGVDYLKYDYCGAPPDRQTAIKRYTVMAEALRKSGRSIVFSVCEWGDRQPWLWARQAGGNLWRTTWDIRDTWETAQYNNGSAGIMNILDHQVGLARHVSPGAWNDPDMLVVGLNARGGPALVQGRGCTDTEYRANMSLWCLLAAPLFAACDLRSMSDTTCETLTHPEIIAINQDPLGQPADRVVKDGDLEVWVRPLADGSMAVGLLNRDVGAAHKIKVQWSDLGLHGGQAVRELWQARDLGVFNGHFETQVDPHEVVVVRLIPEQKKP